MQIKKVVAAAMAFLTILFFPLGCMAENRVYLPIVMYHHISKCPSRWNDYVISPEEFRSDMEFLCSRGYTSISLSQLLDWSRGAFTMPSKPVIISFDDGFSSTAEYAEPILKELGMKAVVAVIGSVCDSYSKSGEFDPEWSDMSWQDAAAMVSRGVFEVQCHSWDMHSLEGPMGCGKKPGESLADYRRRLSADLSRFLTESRKNGLEHCYSIAYPFGVYDRDTSAVIKDMGFQAAFTCTEEINVLTGDREQLYHLGRYNRPHGISSEKFFEKWEIILDRD